MVPDTASRLMLTETKKETCDPAIFRSQSIDQQVIKPK